MTSTSLKRLFLLRHAEALSDGGKDQDRTLSLKGKQDARALGQFMLDQKFMPDLVLCSPAMRTRQTLEGVQHFLGAENVVYDEALYSGGLGDYLSLVQTASDTYHNILVLAHNPSIYALASLLSGEGSDAFMHRLALGYDPATLSVIECSCAQWAHIQPEENKLVALSSPMDYNAPSSPTRWM